MIGESAQSVGGYLRGADRTYAMRSRSMQTAGWPSGPCRTWRRLRHPLPRTNRLSTWAWRRALVASAMAKNSMDSLGRPAERRRRRRLNRLEARQFAGAFITYISYVRLQIAAPGACVSPPLAWSPLLLILIRACVGASDLSHRVFNDLTSGRCFSRVRCACDATPCRRAAVLYCLAAVLRLNPVNTDKALTQHSTAPHSTVLLTLSDDCDAALELRAAGRGRFRFGSESASPLFAAPWS